MNLPQIYKKQQQNQTPDISLLLEIISTQKDHIETLSSHIKTLQNGRLHILLDQMDIDALLLHKALEELTEVYINDLRGFHQQRKANNGEITVVEKELEKMLESVFLLLRELDG